MKLSIDQQESQTTVTVDEARLDAAIATAFKDRMRENIRAAPGLIVLDLQHVNFMDSSGLGAVISVLKSLPDDRRLHLTGLTANVQRVFRLTHMDKVFTIIPPLIAQDGEGSEPGRANREVP